LSGKKEQEQREYSVEGRIRFYLSIQDPDSTDKGFFKQAIQDVDKKFPWQDHELAQKESYKFLSDGKTATDNYHSGGTICSFTIAPWGSLRQTQLHAYEKYLQRMTDSLARMKLPKVTKISWSIQTIKTKMVEC
jgi:hypothetical protein